MSTQTIYAQLNGSRGQAYTATCTDDTFTELVDSNSLSLYQTMKGARITQVLGSYNAGGGYIRVRNTVSNQVKCLGPLAIVTEEKTWYTAPFTVEENDIIEAFCVATPT